MAGFDYRETTRSGGCFHCGHATVEVCVECENFVGPECHEAHNAQDHINIIRSKPAG